jgi:hypothetical protein
VNFVPTLRVWSLDIETMIHTNIGVEEVHELDMIALLWLGVLLSIECMGVADGLVSNSHVMAQRLRCRAW